MRSKIVALFPVLRRIRNKALREQVILAWEMGIFEGEHNLEDLRKVPFTLLIPSCRINLVAHTRAVTSTALAIARDLIRNYGTKIKINQDYLIAGGLLHDVGKLLEYRLENNLTQKSKNGKFLRHTFSGTALAYVCGLPAEVLHMIAVHSREGDSCERSLEAMIIHHADFIHFEAQGGKV